MILPTTIALFAEACKSLDNDAIYDLFECDITQELRDEIYLAYSTETDSEPMREAMCKIGMLYNVQSLIDY